MGTKILVTQISNTQAKTPIQMYHISIQWQILQFTISSTLPAYKHFAQSTCYNFSEISWSTWIINTWLSTVATQPTTQPMLWISKLNACQVNVGIHLASIFAYVS